MTKRKEIKIRDLNDDDCLTRIILDEYKYLLGVPLTCKIVTGSDGDGYFSKEFVSKMIVTMKRAGHSLTDLFISPEDVDDVRKWEDDTVIDPATRRDISHAAGKDLIWNVTLHKRECLTEVSKVCGFSFVDDVVDAVCVGTIDRS